MNPSDLESVVRARTDKCLPSCGGTCLGPLSCQRQACSLEGSVWTAGCAMTTLGCDFATAILAQQDWTRRHNLCCLCKWLGHVTAVCDISCGATDEDTYLPVNSLRRKTLGHESLADCIISQHNRLVHAQPAVARGHRFPHPEAWVGWSGALGQQVGTGGDPG